MSDYSVNVDINTKELNPEYATFKLIHRPNVFKSIQCNVDSNLIMDHAKTIRFKYDENASHFDYFEPITSRDRTDQTFHSGTLKFKDSHPLFDKFEGLFDCDQVLPTNGTIWYKDHPRYLKFEGDVHPNTCHPQIGKLVYVEKHKTILYFQGEFDENGDLLKGEITFKPEYKKKTFQGVIKDRSFESGTVIYNDCHPNFFKRFSGTYQNGEPQRGELVFNKEHPHYFSVKSVNGKDMFKKNGDINYGRVYLKSFPNQAMESFNAKNFYYWEGPFEDGYPIGQGKFGFVFKDDNMEDGDGEEEEEEDSLLTNDAHEVTGFFDKNTLFKSLNGKLSAKNTEKFWELKQKLDKKLLLSNLLENVLSTDRKRRQCDDTREEDAKRRKTDDQELYPRKTTTDQSSANGDSPADLSLSDKNRAISDNHDLNPTMLGYQSDDDISYGSFNH